jgi:hypothetical protein
VLDWANASFSDPRTSSFFDGIAFHWYSGDQFAHIESIRALWPTKLLLPSEATYEKYRWPPGTTLARGSWSFGEGYAHDIIGDLKAGALGWIDWNLLLDEHGGVRCCGWRRLALCVRVCVALEPSLSPHLSLRARAGHERERGSEREREREEEEEGQGRRALFGQIPTAQAATARMRSSARARGRLLLAPPCPALPCDVWPSHAHSHAALSVPLPPRPTPLCRSGAGPNHLGNDCDSAIMANVSSKELHVHPQFYYVGHFSKFVRPGSWLLNASVNAHRHAPPAHERPYGTCGDVDGLESASFLRPDGQVVTVVLNCGAEPRPYKLKSNGLALAMEIPAHAIQTIMHPQEVGLGVESELGEAGAVDDGGADADVAASGNETEADGGDAALEPSS